MFITAQYIKCGQSARGDSGYANDAPRFRKRFTLSAEPVSAEICCAGLGYGYFYLNGQRISQDLFTAPVAAYHKTVWYNRYDVTALLHKGENVLAAVLGNGFFNESFFTAWLYHTAPWRDVPKLIAELHIRCADGTTLTIASDESWLCTHRSPWLFNGVRSGESYDARLYEPGWNACDFDERGWVLAQADDNPPAGVLRECLCPPIREFEVWKPEEIRKSDKGYILCYPRNISGYVRVNTAGLRPGQRLLIQHAEQLDENGKLKFCFNYRATYPECRYGYCELIADGREFVWSPRFSYFGFRYIEVIGLDEAPTPEMIQAVFVHQDVPRIADFTCSDERLNRLYQVGIAATHSNMFYMPTDCPTREKLGWANDMQASTEQFLMDFDSASFLKKWYQDVLDSMKEDGAISGIIPSSGYGYDFGSGPVSTGVLYEIPWRIYEYTGDDSMLKENLPAFRKHLRYIASRTNEKGLIDYGLCDHAGPWESHRASPVPCECTNTLLYIKLLRLTKLACSLTGEDASDLDAEEARIRELLFALYFDESGRFAYTHQCPLAMCLMLDVYRDRDVTAAQLVEAVERDKRHIGCGMLGIQFLYDALELIGRRDLSWAILTAEGFPSYMDWVTVRDATAMCEDWLDRGSYNHHMYSNILAVMMKNLAGIRPAAPGFKACTIRPYFPDGLDFCKAYEQTAAGKVEVEWHKNEKNVEMSILIPEGMEASLALDEKTLPLQPGKNRFTIPGDNK